MGLAADLFYSSDTSRETLHKRITPTEQQYEDQQTRWNDLAAFLRSRLRADSGLPTRTWLQGSYKYETQIRPWTKLAEFDIDLGFYFEWAGKPEDGESKPEDLKSLVQKALKDYQADASNDATGVDKPKERCCRIKFDPDFHIDVPCYHLDYERDARALATATTGWEASDPKTMYEWFKTVREDASERAQLRRQVRYLKMWAALTFEDADRPSSILLTVLAADAIGGYEIKGISDDDLLAYCTDKITERLEHSATVPNPVDANENLNRLDKKSTERLINVFGEFRNIARRAQGTNLKAQEAEIWGEAFGQFFPLPEDNGEELLEAKSNSRELALFAFEPQVRVTAVPRKNCFQHWAGVNELPPIPKDCDITFSLLNADELPMGATLRWMVRNHGDEAIQENDMGHRAGDQIEITEHSAYNGEHAMDLTVYLGSQVIGRRRINVKIRGAAIPPRNRPRAFQP